MKALKVESFEKRSGRFGLAFGVVAALGALGAHHIKGQDAELQAYDPTVVDADLDGITNEQEIVFGTSPWLRDSDSDGIDDGLELALGFSPVVAAETPPALVGGEIGVSLLARGGQGRTYVELLIFAQDGSIDSKNLALSLLTPGGYIPLDIDRLQAFARVQEVALPGGGALRTVTIPTSPMLVQAHGNLHWIAAIGQAGESGYRAAATCELQGNAATHSVEWSRSGHLLPPTTVTPTGSNSEPLTSDGLRIDQPIPPFPDEEPSPPPGTPGEVCVQQTQAVGAGAGSTIITEVVAAGCQPGWAAYCAATACAGNVGKTFEKINPRNLLGG